jgi:hypothetical protein
MTVRLRKRREGDEGGGASLLPEPGCLATHIDYVSRMFNLSMLGVVSTPPHYKGFGKAVQYTDTTKSE